MDFSIWIVKFLMPLIPFSWLAQNQNKNQQPDEYRNDQQVAAPVCGDPYWETTPAMAGGVYYAEIHSVCTAMGTETGGGIPAAREYMRNGILSAAQVLHAGPVEEIYGGLPAQYHDTTEVRGAGTKDETHIRGDRHLASDGTNRALYHSFSTGIEGNGNGKLLKRINIGIVVDKVAKYRVDNFQMKFINYIELKKPWFVPEGTFIKEASKNQVSIFIQERDRLAAEIAGIL